jgi:hypothetical protein
MLVQRVLLPATRRESWTVLGDDGPVQPVERYLAYLTDIERSPNTVRAYAHDNACLTCPMFVTTAEFLPQHHQQRQQVVQIISAAEARGQQRLAEMNRQVLGNLDQIIAALQTQAATAGTGTADAR